MAELAFTLIIGTILLATQMSQVIQTIEQTNSINTGKYLLTLQGGVNKFVADNITALKNGAAITGFANPLQPQISELIAANDLPAGFATASPLNIAFKTVMTKTGTCPSGNDCLISGWAYSTQPYADVDGSVRTDVLTYAVGTIGTDAGMAFAATPNMLTLQGGTSVANPAGSVAGTLGIRVGSGSGLLPLLSQYYALDGSRALTGPMNANGNDINSVGNLQVTNNIDTNNINVNGAATFSGASGAPGAACTSNGAFTKATNGTALVVCSGNVWQLVGNAVSGVSDGQACSAAGQLGTDATGISYVCNGSYWTSMNATANAGDSCAPAGRMAAAINNREQLVCKNGSYVRLVNLIAKSVEVSRQLVTDGTIVSKPSCDVGGTPAYSFQLTQTVVDVSVTPPRQAMYTAAVDNGASWTVQIRLKDNGGNDYSANAYAISAVFKLECSY